MTRPAGLWSRRQILLAVPATAASGCGTLFWSERKNQPNSKELDMTVFWLDAAGLLLFGIGGVIAFALDFSNGTIYLPNGHADASGGGPLVAQRLPGGRPSRAEVEAAASRHFGRPVSLSGDDVRRERLDSVDGFWPAVRRMFRRPEAVG